MNAEALVIYETLLFRSLIVIQAYSKIGNGIFNNFGYL